MAKPKRIAVEEGVPDAATKQESPPEHKAPFIGAKEIMPGFVSAMDALRALRLRKLAGRYPEVAKLLKAQKAEKSKPVAEGAD